MVPLTSLWLPILLSAVIVFVASSVIHMVLGYHNTDFSRLPQQDQVLDALRPFSIPPGDYIAPHAATAAERKAPEFAERITRGPVFALTMFAPGAFQNMGGRLVQWFLFSVLVSVFAAYVAGRTLPPGTDYLQVMRIAGTVAFAGYALAHLPPSIWYDRKWNTTLKNVFDGLVYGLLTGGTFGWLWPAM
jgi:hypothetical protein